MIYEYRNEYFNISKKLSLFWKYNGETDKQLEHRFRTEWLQKISQKKKGKK